MKSKREWSSLHVTRPWNQFIILRKLIELNKLKIRIENKSFLIHFVGRVMGDVLPGTCLFRSNNIWSLTIKQDRSRFYEVDY